MGVADTVFNSIVRLIAAAQETVAWGIARRSNPMRMSGCLRAARDERAGNQHANRIRNSEPTGSAMYDHLSCARQRMFEDV
ncbi:hypothetical protein QW131_31420 [Roseibium salinum]|nr:hypothetical protein [Roseibium salinum]